MTYRDSLTQFAPLNRWVYDLSIGEPVYLSGPMSGYVDFNRQSFHLVEHFLKRTAGCKILSPAHHPDNKPYSWYMREDLAMVLKANRIIRLPGWQQSRGALLEVAVAEIIEVPMVDLVWPEGVAYGMKQA